MFPLEFLPQPWKTFVDFMPFKYLAYFPAAVFLGKVQGAEMVQGLVIQITWVLLFIMLCRMSMQAGFNRYSGYGG